MDTSKSQKGWRWFFYAAATYNIVIGGIGLANMAASANDRIVGLLVLCFGVVYALVGRDPQRFGPVLWGGVLGKAGVIVLLVPVVLAGAAQPATGIVLAGDALFLLGFLIFLLRRS